MTARYPTMPQALTRPKYDAALDSIAAQLPFTEAQRELLWKAMRCAITGKIKPDPRRLRVGWTAEATELRDPLRREIEACRKRDAEGVMLSKFGDLCVKVARPGRAEPAEVNVVQAFAGYRESLVQIQQRMDDALRDGGHWCSPDDALSTGAEPQPIDVVVANERLAGRPAGTRDWTQWEIPKTRALITTTFDLANKAVPRGRLWSPYIVPESSLSERGKAEHARRVAVWRDAFRAAVLEPLDRFNALIVASCAASDTEIACATLLRAFYQRLHDDDGDANPRIGCLETHIDDACRQQARAHRTPNNPRFRLPNSIWHALDKGVRYELAAEYNAVLVQCYETCLAANELIAAASFNPAVVQNPWALTPDELSVLSAAG